MERMRPARFAAVALVAAIIAVLTSGPAWAHNSLTKAVPDKNSTVKQRPEQVELTFLQKVDPQALSISVTDAQKQEVPLETPRAKGKVGTVAFSEPLVNGVYTVTYNVVSLDGHKVKGSYKFTLNDPSATPPPPSTAPTTPPASSAAAPVAAVPASSSSPDDGVGLGPIVAGIAALMVLVGVAAVVLHRRKSS
jgi:methionine-rich copper-binding protein CopC